MTLQEKKYLNDPLYSRIVGIFQHAVHESKLSPYEVLEAAMFACLKMESRNMESMRFSYMEKIDRIARAEPKE